MDQTLLVPVRVGEDTTSPFAFSSMGHTTIEHATTLPAVLILLSFLHWLSFVDTFPRGSHKHYKVPHG